MVCIAFCVICFTIVFSKNNKLCINKIKTYPIINLILLFSFVNVFYVETFIYITPDWGLGLILSFLSFLMFTKKKILLAFLFAILTVCEYQVYLVITGCAILTYIILTEDKLFTLDAVKKYLSLIFVTIGSLIFGIALPIILNFIGIINKTSKKISLENGINFKIRIKEIIEMIIYVFRDAKGMMPYMIIFYFCFGIIALFVIDIFTDKKNKLKKIYVTIICGLLLLIPFCLGFITAGFYMPARVLFPFFFSISMVTLISYLMTDNLSLKKIIVVLSTSFLLISIFNTRQAAMDHYTSNLLDFQYGKEVQEKIDCYERETGETIKVIKYLKWHERDKTWSYSEFLHHDYYDTNYNIKLVYDDWGIVPLIEFISGRKYDEEYMTQEEFNNIFNDVDWSYINLEKQIKFKDETLYWAVY